MAEEETIDHGMFSNWDCVGAIGLLAAFPPVLHFVCYEDSANLKVLIKQGTVFGAVLCGVIGLVFLVAYLYQLLFSAERFSLVGSWCEMWKKRATLLINSMMGGCVLAEVVGRIAFIGQEQCFTISLAVYGIVAIYGVYLLTFVVKPSLLSKIVNIAGISLTCYYGYLCWNGIAEKFERDLLSMPPPEEKKADAPQEK